MRPADYADATDLARQLVVIKDKLGRLGLFKSMHAMDAVTGALGFEIAEHMEHHAKVAKAEAI